MNNSYLEESLYELGLITKKVQAEFGRLSAEQLNWKPAADSWSIAQCLDHLMVTNQQYFPVYEAIKHGRKKTSFWERLPFFPGMWGRLIRQGTDPTSVKKLKAPAKFRPATSHLPATIVTDFTRHQHELIKLLSATDATHHNKVIVTSPINPIITYSLKDCVVICGLHEERHFMQARRVLHQQNFPGHLL
jgi:hypothetical protein